MRAYGMTRLEFGDCDSAGLHQHGHATAVGSVSHNAEGDARAPRSLRGGERAKHRRSQKRRARREGREECTPQD